MKQPTVHLSSALAEARDRGFTHDLVLTDDGDFAVHSSEEIIHPTSIEVIQCYHCGATLYLVAGEEKNGTWVYQWDV